MTLNQPLPVYPDQQTPALHQTELSFDHFVGAREDRLGHIEMHVLCRVAIEDQFKRRWLLHGKVTRACATKDAVDVLGGASIGVDDFRSV